MYVVKNDETGKIMGVRLSEDDAFELRKREEDEDTSPLMKLTESRIGYYNPAKRTWEDRQ